MLIDMTVIIPIFLTFLCGIFWVLNVLWSPHRLPTSRILKLIFSLEDHFRFDKGIRNITLLLRKMVELFIFVVVSVFILIFTII